MRVCVCVCVCKRLGTDMKTVTCSRFIVRVCVCCELLCRSEMGSVGSAAGLHAFLLTVVLMLVLWFLWGSAGRFCDGQDLLSVSAGHGVSLIFSLTLVLCQSETPVLRTCDLRQHRYDPHLNSFLSVHST